MTCSRTVATWPGAVARDLPAGRGEAGVGGASVLGAGEAFDQVAVLERFTTWDSRGRVAFVCWAERGHPQGALRRLGEHRHHVVLVVREPRVPPQLGVEDAGQELEYGGQPHPRSHLVVVQPSRRHATILPHQMVVATTIWCYRMVEGTTIPTVQERRHDTRQHHRHRQHGPGDRGRRRQGGSTVELFGSGDSGRRSPATWSSSRCPIRRLLEVLAERARPAGRQGRGRHHEPAGLRDLRLPGRPRGQLGRRRARRGAARVPGAQGLQHHLRRHPRVRHRRRRTDDGADRRRRRRAKAPLAGVVTAGGLRAVDAGPLQPRPRARGPRLPAAHPRRRREGLLDRRFGVVA